MKSAVLLPAVKRLAGMGRENETLLAAEKLQGGFMKRIDVGCGLPVSTDGVVDGGFLQPKSVIRHAVSVSDWGNEAFGHILPASVRILFLATPRRSPLRLRLSEKHAA